MIRSIQAYKQGARQVPYFLTIADKTQNMKHTPEPWYFVDYADYHELTDAPFYEAIHLLNEDDAPNAADNANRACECVNALAGIENPKEWVEFSKNYRTMLQWEKLESQVKELREAGNALIEAMNQYSFFADGYRNGSASISEVQHANDQQNEAYSKMFDVLKSLNKQP